MDSERKKYLQERIQRVRNNKTTSGAELNKHAEGVGQRIGEILQSVLDLCLFKAASKYHLHSIGGGRWYTFSGKKKSIQIDGRIVDSNNRPLLAAESKWLKDGRHLNDKGAWINDLPNSLIPANPTIKGIFALLAGPWRDSRTTIRMEAQGMRVVLIDYDEMVGFLKGIGLQYEQSDSKGGKRLLNTKKTLLQFCDIEEEILMNDKDPYTVWANKLMEYKARTSTKTIGEEIMEKLIDILDSDLTLEIEGFQLTINSDRGPVKIDVDRRTDVTELMDLWLTDTDAMYKKYIDSFD